MLNTVKRVSRPSFWASLRARLFARQGRRPRIFSEIDYYRLQGLLTKQHLAAFSTAGDRIQRLRSLMSEAMLYPCRAVPEDLVTMNSVLQLRSRRGSVFKIELVYPHLTNRREHKISVLSTLGLALVGRVEGEAVSQNLVIEKILYQPERLGNYYV